MSAGVLFDAPGPKARMRHRMLTGVGVLMLLGGLWVIYKRLDDKGQLTAAMWKPFTTSEMWVSYIVPGLMGTLKAAAISMVLAGILGVLFAMARMSHIGPLRWFFGIVVEVFRAVPVLLVMLFSYGLMTAGPLSDSVNPENAPLYATVCGLVFYNAAVVAEVIRSGVDQLPNGQREAGLAIGLTQSQTLRMIMLPQAITAMLPALISQLVVVLKDTALGYNVLYSELLYSSKNSSAVYANIVPTIFVIAAIYIVVNYAISKFAEYLERRLKSRGRTAGADDGEDHAEQAAETAGVPGQHAKL